MPLYMDIHIVNSEKFSAEDVVRAHMEDLAIQDQFGVKQLKYFVNERAKTIFCLMDGPDKESCNQVHLQSHGNTACNIIEVSDDEYNLYMGQGTVVDDLAKTESGELDPGYRSILILNLVYFSHTRKNYFDHIKQEISRHKGLIVREPTNQLMATFRYATNAISCAAALKKNFDSKPHELDFNIGVVSGKPVDATGETFFEETKNRAIELGSFGFNQKMYLDSESLSLAEKEPIKPYFKLSQFTLLHPEDFGFLKNLSVAISVLLSRSKFTTRDLYLNLGMSKSKASRMIKILTEMAPNQLVQESRLQRALNNLTQNKKTIAEIAYDSGFNSPTYFSRIFKKRFGISPTEYSYQQR
jgi:AraC-like DNA-binding protein